MDEQILRLKARVENDLYKLVLAFSQDELAKVNDDSISNAIYIFVENYKENYGEELRAEDIDLLTDYIGEVIQKAQKRLNESINKGLIKKKTNNEIEI